MHAAPPIPTRLRSCLDCGQVFEGILGLCAECSEARLAEESRTRQAQRDQARLSAYLKVCPVTYRHTDWSHPGLHERCVSTALSWSPDAGGRWRSLGMFGPSGTGKTRTAFHILRRHVLSHDVYAVHASDAWDHGDHVQGISSAAVQRLRHAEEPRLADAARQCLQRARTCGLLLIDDMGKERAGHDGAVSEAVGEALFSLIEYRVAHDLPVIWTCNMSEDDLQKRLGPDRGTPMMRRLREASYVVQM
jgi:DNA replication protein DnaC